MRYLPNGAQMKAADTYTIEKSRDSVTRIDGKGCA